MLSLRCRIKRKDERVLFGYRAIEEEGRKIGYDFLLNNLKARAIRASDIMDSRIRNIHAEIHGILDEISTLD
jgi:hypothetical protein